MKILSNHKSKKLYLIMNVQELKEEIAIVEALREAHPNASEEDIANVDDYLNSLNHQLDFWGSFQ